MKTLLSALTLGLLFNIQAGAAYLVSVSGTASHQENLPEFRFRLVTARFTAETIYREFQVSPRDYVLVVDEDPVAFLSLRPRYATNVNLPLLVIRQNPDVTGRGLQNTATKFMEELTLGNGAHFVSLFDDFRGTAVGRRHTRPGDRMRGQYEVLGSSRTHIFKFHITLGREYVPEP